MADDISEWIVVAVMAAMGLFVGFTIVAFAAGWMDSDNRCDDGWIWVKGEMKPRTVMIGKNTYVVADYPDAKCMEVLP